MYKTIIHSKPTAVKAIKQPQKIERPTFAQRTLEHIAGVTSEAINQSGLSHSNIVFIREYWFQQIDGETYFMISMELCQADLSKWMKNNAFSFDQMVEFALGISAGIEYIADKGKIHKDIKLQNILVSCDQIPIAKISDFGLIDENGGTAGYCGIEHFISPQPGSTDVFGFGQCILRMFCEKDLATKLLYLPIIDPTTHKKWFGKLGKNQVVNMVLKMINQRHDKRINISDVISELRNWKNTKNFDRLTVKELQKNGFPVDILGKRGIHLRKSKTLNR